MARAATLAVTSEDYIRAAELYAVPRTQILVREIFPNITGPLAVEAGLRLTYSIGTNLLADALARATALPVKASRLATKTNTPETTAEKVANR
ncbi:MULTISPECIES: ABC transporter permease subunit [Auritidibacter]|uniref:ABC transporter permease subunit n=1 Tax=Auritidibacter ignavus TaxID=678932 RepID=A0AAJ6DBC7_9MICC|nr:MULTISPECIES: ABC transporter permease subunit [Auritidibacter]WGH92249.1 ABC transporter permease subunit [Auritidibacter ignavus]WHS27078.1 ABC transporter permease subunit [Auritidibacter ignavus]